MVKVLTKRGGSRPGIDNLLARRDRADKRQGVLNHLGSVLRWDARNGI